METVRRLPLLLIALCVLFSGTPGADAARGSREDEAEAEMLKAKQAMERAQYEVAIGHLMVARSLVPDASGPYLNLGIAYERLGRCAEAVPMLEEYLRRRAKSPSPTAAKTLEACRALTPPAPALPARTDGDDEPDPSRAAASPHTAASPDPSHAAAVPDASHAAAVPDASRAAALPGAAPSPAAPPALAPPVIVAPPPPARLSIRVEPVGANLSINGRLAGTNVLDFEHEITPGNYEIRAERPGYHSVSRTGWLVAGEVHVDTLTLKKKRVWPIVVGVVTGVLATGALIAIIVTQVGSSSGSGKGSGGGGGSGGGSGSGSGGGEVGFPVVTTP
jgi:hypothetical protein